MTLILLDSENKKITESSPKTTELNGSTGQEEVLDLTLKNESDRFRYGEIELSMNVKQPLKAKLSETYWPDLGPGDLLKFTVTVKVPERTETELLKNRIRVKARQLPARRM